MAALSAAPASACAQDARTIYAELREELLAEQRRQAELDLGALLLQQRAGVLGREFAAQRIAADLAEQPGVLFDSLARRRFMAQAGDLGQTGRQLVEGEHELLIEALGKLPRELLQAELAQRLASGPSDPERVAALQLWGGLGGSRDVGEFGAWSQPAEDERRPSRATVEALEAALAQWFNGDLGRLQGFPRLLRELHPGAAVALLRAAAAGGEPERPLTLARSLGSMPELDPLLLSEIGHLGARLRGEPPAELCSLVRDALRSENPAVRREAVVAAQRLDDWGAILPLIELMEDPDVLLAEQAFRALGGISGEGLPRSAKAWRDWRVELDAWFEGQVPQLFSDVERGTPAVANRALMELAKGRFQRHELALGAARGLLRREAEVVAVAAATLGALGSTRTVEPLLDLLEAGSDDARRAAYLALKRITGEDHGEQPADWRSAGW